MVITINTRLASLATAMEFTLQLMSRCSELRSGLPFLARRAFIGPFLRRARVTHKLAFPMGPLVHIADSVRLGAHAANGVDVGRMQCAGVADLGAIDEIQGVPVLCASRTHACC